jgi:FixJ family two-component response regulator
MNDALVAVVDDDPGVCRSVSRAIESRGYRVQMFHDAQSYMDTRHAIEPTCVLADIRMQGIDGLAMQRTARDMGDDVPIVFMTAVDDVSIAVEAMKGGAIDLLAKPFTVDALLSAIDGAIARARSSDAEHRSLARLWRALEALTPREAEIAALVASGRLNKQVAAMTGITEKTVKVHRARAMRKLSASSLAAMVRLIDRIVAEKDRRVVHVDGVDVRRPGAVDTMIRALGRETDAATPLPDDPGAFPETAEATSRAER